MVWRWSKTAANNANADATINWAEGQPPSSVNDSARAEMARVAQYRDDIAGAITTAGTSTAYTVSSNQVFDTLAHMDGAMIAFTPHATCGATVTLNVDGLGAKPLRSAPNAELLAGTLIQGTPYVATYRNADSAFYLQSFFGNPYNIPLGGVMPYLGSTAPNSSFVLPYGQAISRSTYASLFSLISTTFGAGDGLTTFNVPDLRGRVVIAQDNMGGVAAGRMTTAGAGIDGTTVGAAGGEQTHTLTSGENGVHAHNVYLSDPGHAHSLTTVTTGGGQALGSGSNLIFSGSSTATATTGIIIHDGAGHQSQTALSVGGAAHNNTQPSIVLPVILRVI